MHFKLFAVALLLTVPLSAHAESVPQPAPSPAPKVKKICRTGPAPTGSIRPGKRVCRTAEEWKQVDGKTADYEGGTNGAPASTKD